MRATIRRAKDALRLLTAKGIITANSVAQVLSKQLGSLRTLLLPNSPAVLSLGRLIAELGFWFVWIPGFEPRLFNPKTDEVLHFACEEACACASF